MYNTLLRMWKKGQITAEKIDRAVDLAKQLVDNGEKVVIYSTFKETLNVLYEKLSDLGVLLCTGDVKDSVIADNVELFQTDPSYMVMLATWQKMGTGITLTASSYAIFIDCAWTSAQNLQAEDRIYRIGSKNPVFIYYLWTNDTVDLRVKEIVWSKEAISNYVVDSTITEQSIEALRKYILDLK